MLDTNVVSEPLKVGGGDPKVIAWLDHQSIETLCLSTFTVSEVLFGIALMDAGRRRDDLRRRVMDEVFPQFAGRIWGFDEDAARANATLRAAARAAARPIPDTDSFIAAVAISRGLALATRNTKHFGAAGLQIINPWD
jgi:predicted nucleic acid-binding protein